MLLALSILLGFGCWLILRRKPLDLFQPLNYASWIFFLPEFVVPGVIFALTSLDSEMSGLLNDRDAEASVAMACALLGFCGLALGYSRRWFRIRTTPSQFELPAASLRTLSLTLLVLGTISQVAAFSLGVLDYSFSVDIAVLVATYSLFAQFTLAAHAIIWFAIFNGEHGWRFLGVLSIACWLFEAAISASRAAFLWPVLLLLATYQYAKPNIPVRRIALRFSVPIVVALILGLAFGTIYRRVKVENVGREATLASADLSVILKATYTELSFMSAKEIASLSTEVFLSRLDAVSNLAVILRDRDKNLAAERSAGITNNILRDAFAGFIPRVLWPTKPAAGNAEEIGYVYFGSAQTSPTITYMGDLYRNFGRVGVFLGMFILGLFLRGVYASLIEGHTLTPLRVASFLFLMRAVNYESPISPLFPILLRQFVLLWIILWLAGKLATKKVSSLAVAHA